MNKSESIKELASALSKAQGEIPAVKFNATNPFLKNKYADLGAIIETSKTILAKNGLSVSQLPEIENNMVRITTILMHSSGEWIESISALSLEEQKGLTKAQAAGSLITYLRRYSLASILGMYADEDGDGNKPEVKKDEPTSKLADAIKAEGGKLSMTLETANNVTNQDGVKYGDLPSDKLKVMPLGINKGLDKPGLPQDKIDEYHMKLDAIKVILQSREQSK